MEGIVVKFDDKRGFGFIRTKELPKDVFVHIQEVHEQQNLSRGIQEVHEQQNLSRGQKVQFDTKQTTKGLSAVNVIPGAKQTSPFFLYGMTAVIIAYIVSVNLTTFLFYGYDKMIAGGSFLRVPELVLQGLSLSGGSPAGLIAQKFFRHKTVKGSFQLVYWAIVVVQVIVLAWFFLV